jgi:hypothetical protein
MQVLLIIIGSGSFTAVAAGLFKIGSALGHLDTSISDLGRRVDKIEAKLP